MNKLFIGMAMIIAISCGAAHAGKEGGGGGGKKEPLFKTIASNIEGWIRSGNADAILTRLPNGISLSQYKSQMLDVLDNYRITFTDDKVLVNEHEKTCRGYVDDSGVNQILCNNIQFGSDTPENINELYRQVHHEFAGLACGKDHLKSMCLEQNNADDSDYRISDFISGYLRKEVVMRLPVVKVPTTNPAHLISSGTCWADGYEGRLASNIKDLLIAHVASDLGRKGISINASSADIQMRILSTGTSRNGYTDIYFDTASFQTADGSALELQFFDNRNVDQMAQGEFKNELASHGFDREGNPILPECYIKAQYNLRVEIINARSGVRLDRFTFPPRVQIY